MIAHFNFNEKTTTHTKHSKEIDSVPAKKRIGYRNLPPPLYLATKKKKRKRTHINIGIKGNYKKAKESIKALDETITDNEAEKILDEEIKKQSDNPKNISTVRKPRGRPKKS